MKGITELLRQKIGPIRLWAGDSITLTYDDAYGVRHDVMTRVVDRTYVFDEAVVFEAEPGSFGQGAALGGAFVEKSS